MANNTKTSTNHSAKKRAVISYDNMSAELLAAFKEKYPRGYTDYAGDIFKVDKPDGSFFYAVYLELTDAIYLVKIDVDIDDYEKAEEEIFDDGEVGDMDGEVFPDEGGEMDKEDDQMDE